MSERDEQRQNELADRLVRVAMTAEQLIGPHRALLALLGAALTFALQRNPTAEVIELLRKSADELQRGAPSETIN